MNFWDITLTDLVQIAFWLIVGTLTLLTYKHARQTVFQPLKTEVFKLQIVSLGKLSEELYGKGEIEFFDEYDLRAIFDNAAWEMVYTYASADLNANMEPTLEDWREKILSHRVAPPWRPTFTEKSESPSKTSFLPYRAPLLMTEQHQNSIRRLELLGSDPLLPAHMAKLVEELLALIHENVHMIPLVLEGKANVLPRQLPTVESLSEAGLVVAGLWNEWNGRRPKFEAGAEPILKAIRNYYTPDEIGFIMKDAQHGPAFSERLVNALQILFRP